MENYNENILKLRVKEEKLKEELSYWENEFVPSGNMGKWGRQTKLDKIKKELDEIQKDIEFHDSVYLSNEIYKEWKDTNITN
jgi:hypothetical protein